VPFAVAVRTSAHVHYRRSGFPDELRTELGQVAEELGLERGISVRSSATLEDLAGSSFAGVYETFLDVKGEANAVANIERCWASASAEKARSYLDQIGAGDEVPDMAVILQRMVRPVAAGVAFSSDPLNPARDEVVIEAVPGLAEKLVDGSVTPWRVRVSVAGGVIEDVAAEVRRTASAPLATEQWAAIAALARDCEKAAAGRPQDVEWAVDGDDKIWLLQTRPITALEDRRRLEAPAGTWTRGIAVDLWADRLTPFLAEAMIRNSPRYDFSSHARFVGVTVVQPSLTTIDGYLYVNCDSLVEVLRIVPRPYRTSDLLALFPPGFDADSVSPVGLGRLITMGLRALLLGLVVPQANPLFCEGLSRRGLRQLDRRLSEIEARSATSAAEALEIVGDGGESLAQLQIRNQFPYLYATVFTLALRWLAVDRFGLRHGDFLELISGRTDNVTSNVEREVRSLAALVWHDRDLLERFRTEEPSALVGSLPEPFSSELERFLAEYGFRARHRTIHVARWRESPEELLGMVKTLVAQDVDPARERSSHTPARESPIRKQLSLTQWWVLRVLYRLSRRYLDLREDLRFFLDKILFSLRCSLLDLGDKTALGEDVFFLSVDELEKSIQGTLDEQEARALVAERRREFERADTPPAFVVHGRAIDNLPARGDLLRGIGTSPGRRTGRARIVEDPSRSELDSGDILVARNTDPGWTPVLSIAAGVVVEEGGLLNHCSIVARELKIPAVVGVRDAVARVAEGAEITIDGDLGIVQLGGSPPPAEGNS
jgi:pyruvate,water dikinase